MRASTCCITGGSSCATSGAILGLAFAVGLFTTVWAWSLQPVYRSTATLLIGGNETVTVSSQEESSSRVDQGKFLGTQYELLRSRKVAQTVLEQLVTDRAALLDNNKTGCRVRF